MVRWIGRGRTAPRERNAPAGPAAETLVAQVDGTPAPGPEEAGLGLVVQDGRGRVILWGAGRATARTSTEAEYAAVHWGLRAIAEAFPGVAVRCCSDNFVVVNQLAGRFAVRDSRLQARIAAVRAELPRLGVVEFRYIPRTQNGLADALAHDARLGRVLRGRYHLSDEEA